MIELELKFAVERAPAALAALQLLKEKSQVDVYYDTPDYALLKRGGFLRIRNGARMDFKGDFSFGSVQHDYCNETNFDIFSIVDKSEAINKLLNLYKIPALGSYENFDDMIAKNNLQILATIDKSRREYKLGDMKIALDDTKNIGLFIEAETEAPDDTSHEELMKRKARMHADLIEHKIISPAAPPVKIGYVELYLARHNPAAYELGLYK
ncbi:MAG: CYTH domain-containing protein [Alphaproteobacteria bacterium]|nr:CYTH domain-containing protein [Alphaproteobacteria bacterium]